MNRRRDHRHDLAPVPDPVINLYSPQTCHYEAIVEFFGMTGTDGVRECRVYHRYGLLEGWTWIAGLPARDFATIGRVTTMEMRSDVTEFLILSIEHDEFVPLSNVLCEEHCPVDGVIEKLSDLIESLENVPLYLFAKSALLVPEALEGYWTTPAATSGPYSYIGGLAERSLDLARLVSRSTKITEKEKQLAIVYALLHGYWKIWLDSPRFGLKPLRQTMPISYTILTLELSILLATDPSMGARLSELLGGPKASTGRTSIRRIKKIVMELESLLDQYSR